MSEELEHIWARIQAELARSVDEDAYRLWLEPLRICGIDDEQRLLIGSPAHASGWVRERFGRMLQTCAARILGPSVHVEVDDLPGEDDRRSPRSSSRADIPRRSAQAHSRGHGEVRPSGDPTLRAAPELLGNPKLTFNQFVIGDCNRLAHAAALTVAEMPAQAYNPLFICGPPGVGKTHLMRAIASLLASHNPELIVRVGTGESFTNEFLLALNEGGLEGFKARFRHVDVLLIDDVQFLERKARTEEEFFHTFNWLHDVGSQVVLSSDRPPNDLQALEDRLRERFEAGLVADISPPDLNTRIAILRKRVQQDNVVLQDEKPLRLIAERIVDNVRTLEGALIRCVAFSSLTRRALDSALAGEVLDGLYPPAPTQPRSSVADIQRAACKHFGLSPQELTSSSRAARIAWPRQVAMYLARELTDESLPAIGRHFGGRDHTTVLHAWRRAGERICSDPASRQAVDKLLTCLREGSIDRGT